MDIMAGCLGYQTAEAAWLLPDFVAFLDEHGQTTETVQAALTWVRFRENDVVTTVSPRRITAVRSTTLTTRAWLCRLDALARSAWSYMPLPGYP
ncbi:hypothetical protein [Dactylosporangium sucinum]|nr:hypothetical protein [Dactylosporangium sucinum]